LAGLLNALVFGIVHNLIIDGFSGLGPNRLDVFIKSRLFEFFISSNKIFIKSEPAPKREQIELKHFLIEVDLGFSYRKRCYFFA